MNVRRVSLRNFTVHTRAEFSIPEKGVLVVTGQNGAGKSSIVEAVAWAAWNKTLRGTSPCQKDKSCIVELDCDRATVTRTRNGAKADLSFSVDGKAEQEWPTNSKAQEALEDVVGSWDVWRRSHVFSSADAAHFTQATDAERKRLIEGILGLTRFDDALDDCRADLSAAKDRLAAAMTKKTTALGALQLAVQNVTFGRTTLGNIGLVTEPDRPGGRTVAELDRMLRDCETEISTARQGADRAARHVGSLEANLRQIETTLDRVRHDRCPTCTQAINPALRDALASDAHKYRDEINDARVSQGAAIEESKGLVSELEEERAALLRRRQARAQEDRDYSRLVLEAAANKLKVANAMADVQRAEESCAALQADLDAAEEVVRAAEAEVAELEAVLQVVGLKGVRAHLLGHALGGLEQVANVWLGRLGMSHLTLSLLPYSEKKTGGVTDSISIEVAGAGGGHGYKGASSGERRRLDVALLLAMSEVAGAAQGMAAGTLWFDEVFDALDEEGTEAVVSALGLLAQERAVVVITHARHLVDKMPGVNKIHITKEAA